MKSREYIIYVLKRVFLEDAYASILLRKPLVDKEEMGFVSEVVYGTIRNYLYLENQWRDLAKKVKKETALLIDMSIDQLFFCDSIPHYATLHEAVELAHRQEKRFVNFILREVERRGRIDSKDLYIQYSHPKWIINLWEAHYGEEKAIAILKHNQKPALVYGRINALKTTKEEMEKDYPIHFLNEYCFVSDKQIQHMEAFKEGKVVIQNISSQKVVEAIRVKKGMKILDVCASPGTKTQQIAMLMENEGTIDAFDLYQKRVDLLDELMQKTGVTIVNSGVRDARIKHPKEEYYDRILMDVPCSGLGDLAHKPEIRWHIQPEDIDEIVSIQQEILEANCLSLKKGGLFVYSTCTLNKKENEKQIAQFLLKHKEFTLLEEHTLFPDEINGDGFYYAIVRRGVN